MSQSHFVVRPFPDNWPIPTGCTGRILVAGLAQGHEAYYLIDFGARLTRLCLVLDSGYSQQMQAWLEQHLPLDALPYGVLTHEALLPNFIQPHEALSVADGRVVVAMHNTSYMRVIDFEQQQIGAYPDATFRPVMLSATNSLNSAADTLYFASTSLHDRALRYADGVQELDTRILACDVDLTSPPEEVFALKTNEAIHEVRTCGDSDYLILTEFPLVAPGAAPPNQGNPFSNQSDWQAYREAGLHQAQLYRLNLNDQTGEVTRPPWATPGHIEFSLTNPDQFYLSCHNLSKTHGRLLLHGAGALIKGHVEGDKVYYDEVRTTSEFLRVTSHKVFRYGDEARVAVTVYPDKFYLFRDSDFSLIKAITLFEHPPIDVSGQLHFCVLQPHMPLWIETSDDGRFVILVSNTHIYIYDQTSDTLETCVGYSADDGFMGTAHITNLNDFVPPSRAALE